MVYERTGKVRTASAKAGMCRQTVSKYLKQDKLPSELKHERTLSRTHRFEFGGHAS